MAETGRQTLPLSAKKLFQQDDRACICRVGQTSKKSSKFGAQPEDDRHEDARQNDPRVRSPVIETFPAPSCQRQSIKTVNQTILWCTL